MQLYSRSTSSASYRVRIALNLKGLTYNLKPITMEDQRASSEFKQLNPQVLVPLLLLEDKKSKPLGQSLAIMEFLEEKFPGQGTPLLPSDAFGRARVRSLAQHVACEIQPLQSTRTNEYIRDVFKQPAQAVQAWQGHWISLGLDALETELKSPETGKFCHGNSMTIADCYLVPQCFNLLWRPTGLDLAKWPIVERIYENCLKELAVQQADPFKQPDAPKNDKATEL